jgi:hypothetical protein
MIGPGCWGMGAWYGAWCGCMWGGG